MFLRCSMILVASLFCSVSVAAQEVFDTWRYTTEAPGDDWQQAAFDDSNWNEGDGGFGTRGTPGSRIGTQWDTNDIWLRKKFDLASIPARPALLLHHDEDATVYINGILATHAEGYTSSYVFVELTPEGHTALRPGENLIAIHCRQTSGGQYIDAGLLDLSEPPEKK